MKNTPTTHISSDLKILAGKPTIKGTRISVEFILELLRSGMTIQDIASEYEHLKRADVEAAIVFAKHAVAKHRVYSISDYITA